MPVAVESSEVTAQPISVMEDSDDLWVLFDSSLEFTDQEIQQQFGATFDELTELAVQNPSETETFTALRSLIIEVKTRGYIDQAMQMAMTLGAVACNHTHLQGLANEIGDLMTDIDHTQNDHTVDHQDDSRQHDSKTCRDCLAGKPCRKKH